MSESKAVARGGCPKILNDSSALCDLDVGADEWFDVAIIYDDVDSEVIGGDDGGDVMYNLVDRETGTPSSVMARRMIQLGLTYCSSCKHPCRVYLDWPHAVQTGLVERHLKEDEDFFEVDDVVEQEDPIEQESENKLEDAIDFLKT